jgi:hypothetical protein
VSNFQARSDLANKSSIRSVERSIRDEFRAINVKIFRQRLCNTKFSVIYSAMKRFIISRFGKVHYSEELCYYMIGMTKLGNISKKPASRDVKGQVKDFLDVCNNFSKFKFARLLKSQLFSKVCNLFGDEALQSMIPEFNKTD